MKVLFINHKKSQCGVYEFGKNIARALKKSSSKFLYFESQSFTEIKKAVKKENPDLIIYNYHPATMSWLSAADTKKIICPQIGIIHEVTQQVADIIDNSLFDFHIAHDPTLLLKNPLVFKAGRLIPRYENKFELPPIPTIGSFVFAGKKGQKRIVEMVQKEFDTAIIRFNIPFSTFGDPNGIDAQAIAEDCRQAVVKQGIKLEISHDFLEEQQLLDFLAQNTINLFLYEQMEAQRGISGTPDLALAVKRPIGITRQNMFRHILETTPSICVEDSLIKGIIENGVAPLEHFYDEWTEEVICWDYERIAKTVLDIWNITKNQNNNSDDSLVIRHLKKVKRFIKQSLRLEKPAPIEKISWIADTSISNLKQNNSKKFTYSPAIIPEDWSLNNILDDKARKLFEGTINQMLDYLPDLMKRKIPEANVQQAFVLDSVYKIISKIDNPKTLCIGSFEDSAADSLKLLGFNIVEIDPMVNYDLNTFMTKPTTVKNSFDLVFSTSVIEHVENDGEFIEHIVSLLKKGGVAVLTCDYLDSYKIGDSKPIVDYRLYTQKDFSERLFSKFANCEFLEKPQWDCPNPDFWYEGVNYTFATIVVKKIN